MDENQIINKLLEHDRKFDELKFDFQSFRDEILSGQDEIIKILQRLDQERIFTTQWVKRIESEVEAHRREIDQIKSVLKIS